MTVRPKNARPATLAVTCALAVFLATGAYTLIGAQPPEPDSAADETPLETGQGATAASGPVDPTAQPIDFSHEHHVTEIGIDCQFCHAYARRGPVAGIPSVQRCAGCHQTVLSERPEIVKVLEYWDNKEPIPWVRVHDLPDYVRFSHKPHIRAGVNCANCHGDVAHMEAAVQVESLSMGWCLDCHKEREASRDCLVCHY
jgi:hypothetical protein